MAKDDKGLSATSAAVKAVRGQGLKVRRAYPGGPLVVGGKRPKSDNAK